MQSKKKRAISRAEETESLMARHLSGKNNFDISPSNNYKIKIVSSDDGKIKVQKNVNAQLDEISTIMKDTTVD